MSLYTDQNTSKRIFQITTRNSFILHEVVSALYKYITFIFLVIELVYSINGRRSGSERRNAACARDILRFIDDEELVAWSNIADGVYSKIPYAYFLQFEEILSKY